MKNECRHFLESNIAGVNRSFFKIYSSKDDDSGRFKLKNITDHKVKSKIITLWSMEKPFMTKQLIQI